MKSFIFFACLVFCGVCAFFGGQLRNVEQACLASAARTDNGIAVAGDAPQDSALAANPALQVAEHALAPPSVKSRQPKARQAQQSLRRDLNIAPPDLSILKVGQTVCLASGACEPVAAVTRLRASWFVRTRSHSGEFGRAGGVIAPTPETSRIMGVVR